MNTDKNNRRQVFLYSIGCVWILLSMLAGPVWGQQKHEWQNDISLAQLSSLYPHIEITSTEERSVALNKVIQLQLEEVSLVEAIGEVAKKAGLQFSYSRQQISTDKQLTLHARQITVKDAMRQLLADTDWWFAVLPSGHLVLIDRQLQKLQALQETITGTVTDAATGQTLPGVNIIVKGTTNGTASDSEGNYSLTVTSLQDTLVFSFIGYRTLEVPISNRTQVDVAMETQTYSGEELVVVGYGQREREELTGSVSTISVAEAKSGQPIANISNALHGASGLYVSLRNSQPGVDRSTVRIRGVGTLNNSSPLVLVNGVEYSMDELNPNDIATVTVLKDASAAIYGSRAANGVILITTKEGGMKSKITYNTYMGFERPTFMPDAIWDPIKYMKLKNQAVLNSGQTMPEYSQEEIDEYQNGLGQNPYLYPANNWFDIALEDGFIQKHDLSFSGGSENYTYRLSLGFLDRDGIIIGDHDSEEKYSLGLNTTFHVSDKFEVGLTLNGYYRWYERPVYGMGGFWNGLMRSLPIMPDRLESGEYAYTWLRTSGRNNWEHPRMLAMDGHDKKIVQRFLSTIDVSYELPFNLVYEARFGVDKYDGFRERHVPQMYKIQAKTGERYNWNSPSTAPRSYNYDYNDLSITFYNTLNWEHTFAGLHNLDVMVGASYDNFDNRGFSAAMTGYFDDRHPIPALDAGTIRHAIGGSSSRDVLESYFGRVYYNYSDRYLLDLVFRFDGSSRFAPGNRWGFFPSIAAAWRVDQEAFFPSDAFVSTLKLRASVGEMGNQAVSLYSYENSVEVGEDYNFGGQLASGAAVNDYTDPNISWETTRTYNIGVDASFWENRLGLILDVYKKHTTDILRPVNIPAQVGNLGGPRRNVGAVDNTGFEIQLSYNNTVGDFSYDLHGNLNYNKNEVADLNGQILYGDGTNLSTITQEGYMMNAYYILEAEGIFQTQAEVDQHATQDNNTAPGFIKYKDQNGDGIINGDDRIIINASSIMPKYTFGFGFDLRYKGVTLSAFLQGITGIKIYPSSNLAEPFNNGANATKKWLTDAWTPENTDASLPIITESTGGGGNYRPSDFWLYDGSYLRVKNIQLSYTIPQKWLNTLNLGEVTVFVNAHNWITFSKYDDFDPESITNASTLYHYPMLKTFTGGLNITF